MKIPADSTVPYISNICNENFLSGKHTDKLAQQVKGTCQTKDLNSILGLTWQKERLNSQNLSPDPPYTPCGTHPFIYTASSTKVLGNLVKLIPISPCTKIYYCIKSRDVKLESLKLLNENTGRTLSGVHR